MNIREVTLSDIRIDGGTQLRTSIHDAIVSEYTEAIQGGDVFPLMTVFFDGATNWLGDGFHRWHANRAAGIESVSVDQRLGSRRDAVLFSMGANAAHGLRRSIDDKRKAVKTMLDDAEWTLLSDRKIAEHCAVTHPFVAKMRATQSGNVTTQAPAKVVPAPTPAAEKPEADPVPSWSGTLVAAATQNAAPETQEEEPAHNLLHDLQDADKENRRLMELNKGLMATDTGREIAQLHERCLGLEGRLNQEIATKNEAITQAKGYEKTLRKIADKVGVKFFNDILGALK